MTFAQTKPEITGRIVYLWDVTLSMHGGYCDMNNNTPHSKKVGNNEDCKIRYYKQSDDIYDMVLEALIEDVNDQIENTEIVVIPFGNKVLDCWREQGTEEGKSAIIDKMKSFCDTLPRNVGGTSLSGALEYACENVFGKDDVPNILLLATDGCEYPNKPTKLYNILANWCTYMKDNNIDSYAFILSQMVLKDKSLQDRFEKGCFTTVNSIGEKPNFKKVRKCSNVSISPSEMNIVAEDFGKPYELQVQLNSNEEEKTVEVHFEMEKNPYFELSKTETVQVGMNKVILTPKAKLTTRELREQLPPTRDFTINFSLVNAGENVILQSDKCVLTYINKPLKQVIFHIEQPQIDK